MKDKSVSELKIVIVDDHELILQGTISAIQSHFVAPEIYTAKYATAGIDLVQEVNPDGSPVDRVISFSNHQKRLTTLI